MKFAWIVSVLVGPLALACSASEAPSNAASNGVDDVRKACELRIAWTQSTTVNCTVCTVEATREPCTCATNAETSACHTQQAAMLAEADCTSEIGSCRRACAASDCACIEGCYAAHARCLAKMSAVDGCVAAVCEARCK